MIFYHDIYISSATVAQYWCTFFDSCIESGLGSV